MFLCFASILMFVTVPFYAYVFVRLSVIIPALMVENLGPVQAVRRSWQLVQGYWWRTFALMLVLGILGAVISAGPAYLVTALVTLFTGTFDPVLTTAVTAIVSVITEAFFIPLSLTCYTLYYFDLRVRKEGFDLETALDQRYAPPGAAPGGYYAGPQGQYPPAGAYPPPLLGYGAEPQPQPQPQYPTYPQQAYPQGYEYPGQSYTQPQTYSQPEVSAQGATALPASPGGGEGTGANTGTVEAAGAETPRTEGLGFSTPSIAEQAAQPPSAGSEPQVQDSAAADTPSTGKLEPPRHGSDTPAPDER
jgi:hypothetical protein